MCYSILDLQRRTVTNRTVQSKRNDEPRSTIWSVGTEDIGAYFGLYVLLYMLGTVGIVWLHTQRAGPVHEIVTGIITNMSLLGVGIAPTAAIVLTEIWGYAVILSRKLRIEVEAKEKRLREEEERLREEKNRLRKEGHEEGREEGRVEGREEGREAARKELIDEIAALGHEDLATKLREREDALS